MCVCVCVCVCERERERERERDYKRNQSLKKVEQIFRVSFLLQIRQEMDDVKPNHNAGNPWEFYCF